MGGKPCTEVPAERNGINHQKSRLKNRKGTGPCSWLIIQKRRKKRAGWVGAGRIELGLEREGRERNRRK